MAILKIACMGHPVLREVAHPIPPDQIRDPGILRLVADMIETLAEYEGAGLAAPQVHASVRLVVLAAEEGAAPLVLVNPELTWLTGDRVRTWEGCLSVPGLRALVERVAAVRVDAWNEAGERITLEIEGFPAVAVQHECDHLDGVLYVERCDPRTLTFLDELRRFGPPGGRSDDPAGSGDDEAEPDPTPDAQGAGAEGGPVADRLQGLLAHPPERAVPPAPDRRARLLRGRAVLHEN